VLVRQLLTLSRRDVVRPRIVDLDSALADMHKMLRRVIGEDIDLITKPGAAQATVKIDPGQIEQVVLNLAVNARDAMPAGGRLTIETSSVVLDDADVARQVGLAAGPHVQLRIRDNGSGMTDEVKARIFEPFFTTKPIGKGTGLGLATVYGIVSQNHGSVQVESTVGEGTTFAISLPRAVEEARDDDDERPFTGFEGGTECVLIVEDESSVRTLAEHILASRGYHVLTAAHAAEAMQVVEASGRQIDLLLTDVVMPGVNGRELANRLRSMRPGLRVIFMSGYTDDAIIHHGVVHANVPFVEKPFTPLSLLNAVRHVLDAPRLSAASS
jgi:CheY-like chemotaxis protein